MEISTIITLVILAALGFWAVAIYNQLVALKNRYKNAFAQIEVQLKRRYDLIPNLVETAKGYLEHERETLEAVTAARDAAGTALAQAAPLVLGIAAPDACLLVGLQGVLQARLLYIALAADLLGLGDVVERRTGGADREEQGGLGIPAQREFAPVGDDDRVGVGNCEHGFSSEILGNVKVFTNRHRSGDGSG